ncbi:G patch domain-containing protein 2-like isoform X2 [Littorina saxatilis]|uniref:G patch domain-containing protein 2-like isoform X2 n=1 Tax=Littorina saxatilis TaxID=31220 RepID=UPI0038B5E74E
MENKIVHDFQNLRVFSNRHINKMDELVQDLSNALEETSKGGSRVGGCQENSLSSGAVARRYHKRRRGARRSAGNLYWKRGTISEASESSVDEAIRDYIDNSVVAHSDSDDLSRAYSKQRLAVAVSLSEPVPPVESDSFTENLSPMRPQRRRRRYKHMAVDALQSITRPDAAGDTCSIQSCVPHSCVPSTSGLTLTQPKAKPIPSSTHSDPLSATASTSAGFQNAATGKRKRSSKSRTEGTSKDHRLDDDKDSVELDSMDVASILQESSSLSSSEFDSDVYNNKEEGREADDEQSDFFHEPDPVCDVPDIAGWWDKDAAFDGSMAATQKEFDTLLSGALSNMSMTSQKNFRQRVDKMIARAEMPRYTMMRFLQERERWNSLQGGPAGPHFSPGASWNSGCNSQSGDYKRLRQTPPPVEEGFVGVNASPIPDTNIGNQMLQSMGWTPGSGLGAEGDGRKDPVVAYRRRGRKGLGYDTQSDT